MRKPQALTMALLTLGTLARMAPAAWAQDPLPDSAVMVFKAFQCPAGWDPYDDADGRILLPSPNAMGAQIGERLIPGADPVHRHFFASDIDLRSVSYALVAGCSANCLARAGRYHFADNTDFATTGLPYVQLFVCIKTDVASAGTVPSGFMSYFFRRACPTGWSEPLTPQGRIPVGLPLDGSPGASFGGPPFTIGSTERRHNHFFAGTVNARTQDIAGASGGFGDGYGGSGSYPYHAFTDSALTNWPYILLRLCQKN